MYMYVCMYVHVYFKKDYFILWMAVGLSKRSPVEPGLKHVLCSFLWMQWR